jgi:hypothetical protein
MAVYSPAPYVCDVDGYAPHSEDSLPHLRKLTVALMCSVRQIIVVRSMSRTMVVLLVSLQSVLIAGCGSVLTDTIAISATMLLSSEPYQAVYSCLWIFLFRSW